MKAVSKILAGGVAIAALASAAPAAAQYYPGYGSGGYGSGGNVISQVLNQVLGGYGQNGYNSNTRYAVQQCAAAVEQRINGRNNGYGGYGGNSGYGGYGGYGAGYGSYGGYAGGGRVLGITHADVHSGGRVKVKGVASSGMNSGYGGYGGYSGYGGYGGGYGAQSQADLRFNCTVDYRGYISQLEIDRNNYSGYRGY
ncbi:MAG: hypothetical protein ABIW03_05995 [Sphingomicrobium sp.]